MKAHEALRTLARLGTAQNRKVYARHGAGPNQFGVSFANLGKLRKQIGTDHALAGALWASGNHDAQVLATMIADPKLATDRMLESWAGDLSNYGIAGLLAVYASKTSFARAKVEQWTNSDDEWIGRAGWMMLARIAMHDPELADAYFEKHLAVIGRDIHTRQNYVRDAMNSALIAIGVRNRSLHKRALDVAKKIGKVEVDYGETGCKTPDAAEYMARCWARNRRPRVGCC